MCQPAISSYAYTRVYVHTWHTLLKTRQNLHPPQRQPDMLPLLHVLQDECPAQCVHVLLSPISSCVRIQEHSTFKPWREHPQRLTKSLQGGRGARQWWRLPRWQGGASVL